MELHTFNHNAGRQRQVGLWVQGQPGLQSEVRTKTVWEERKKERKRERERERERERRAGEREGRRERGWREGGRGPCSALYLFYVCILKTIYMYVIWIYVHMSAGVHRGLERVSDPLDLKLQVAWVLWKSQMYSTNEPPLQPLHIDLWKAFFKGVTIMIFHTNCFILVWDYPKEENFLTWLPQNPEGE